MPAVASTESANPAVLARPGSTSSSPTTAAPRPRTPRCQPPRPSPTRATAPMAAARSTLGSVRASSTKPTIPATPTTPSQRPRTPTQRATTSRNPTTRVRFVPETAVRCVRPVVLKSSTSPGGIPASSPSTRAGTSACWLGGPVGHRVADRGPQGLGGPPGRSRGSRGLRWPARGHGGGQVARVLDGCQPAGEADPFPDGDPLPGVVAEHQDGLVPTHRDPHQHPVAEATLDPPWVARHRARHGHQGALLGGRRDRPHAHRLGPDQRHHPDPTGHREHRQGGEGRPPPPGPEDGHQQRRGRDEGEHPDDARPPPHEQRPGPRRQAEERQPQVRRGHSVT